MEFKLADLVKFTVAIVVAVVGTTAWMDNRFITVLEAKDFATAKKVDKLQKIITFQQLNAVWRDIEEEEKKPSTERNKAKLEIYYEAEDDLKKELGVK